MSQIFEPAFEEQLLYTGITDILPDIKAGNIVLVTYNQDWGPKLYIGTQKFFDEKMTGPIVLGDVLIVKPNSIFTYLGFVEKRNSTYSKLLFKETIYYLYLKKRGLDKLNAQFSIIC